MIGRSKAAQKHLGNVAYGVAKAATDKMTADMAEELRSHGVSVVSLYPGLVRTVRTRLRPPVAQPPMKAAHAKMANRCFSFFTVNLLQLLFRAPAKGSRKRTSGRSVEQPTSLCRTAALRRDRS